VSLKKNSTPGIYFFFPNPLAYVYEVGVMMAGVEVRSASGYTPIVDKGVI
jgi:hypothetical protein